MTNDVGTSHTMILMVLFLISACELDSIRASGEFLDGMPRSPISAPDSWHFQDIQAPFILLFVKSLTLPRLDELRFTVDPGAVDAATYTLINPDMSTNGDPMVRCISYIFFSDIKCIYKYETSDHSFL